jgi:hypothetical protein
VLVDIGGASDAEGIICGRDFDQFIPQVGWDRAWLLVILTFVGGHSGVEDDPRRRPVPRLDLLEERNLGCDRLGRPCQAEAKTFPRWGHSRSDHRQVERKQSS